MPNFRLNVRALIVGSLACAVLSACASAPVGEFEWAESYLARNAGPSDATYLISVGDLISISVFNNEKMSARTRVRSDGNVVLPLINDVQVVGKAPSQVAAEIEKTLRDANLVLNPRVNVAIEEVPAIRITVIGAVKGAGILAIERGSGVAEALAAAGGLTDFAKKDRIFVIRKQPTPVRLRFTFSSLTALGKAGAFRLQQGDIVVVE